MSARLSSSARRLAAPWALAVAVLTIAAAPAWAVTPKNGHYTGFVDPFSLSFTVANGKLSHFVSDFQPTTCPGFAPSNKRVFFTLPSVKIVNGHFSDSKSTHNGKSQPNSSVKISGSFSKPTSAAGKLHEHIAEPKNFGTPSCTLSQAFSVTLASGK